METEKEYFVPSDNVTKSLIPKSIPIFPSLVCLYSFSCSTKIETKYFPIGVLEIVKDLTSPIISL